MKVCVTLPSAVHQAAKIEAVQCSLTLSAYLARVLNGAVNKKRMKRPVNKVSLPFPDENGTVRPSVELPAETAEQVTEHARADQASVPEFCARVITRHFSA